MIETMRPLLCPLLPALDPASPPAPRRAAGATVAPRGRLAACLVALALPVIGIAAADMVHRTVRPMPPQAAAPRSPSDGAAATEGASRPIPVREALFIPNREARR